MIGLIVTVAVGVDVTRRHLDSVANHIERRAVGGAVRKRSGDDVVEDVVVPGQSGARPEDLIRELAVGVGYADRESREELVIDAPQDFVGQRSVEVAGETVDRDRRSRVRRLS